MINATWYSSIDILIDSIQFKLFVVLKKSLPLPPTIPTWAYSSRTNFRRLGWTRLRLRFRAKRYMQVSLLDKRLDDDN